MPQTRVITLTRDCQSEECLISAVMDRSLRGRASVIVVRGVRAPHLLTSPKPCTGYRPYYKSTPVAPSLSLTPRLTPTTQRGTAESLGIAYWDKILHPYFPRRCVTLSWDGPACGEHKRRHREDIDRADRREIVGRVYVAFAKLSKSQSSTESHYKVFGC
ncbi:hypothetical protein BJ322DRAFT_782187 [Thelephora terrestris]|uniref:Uncharacterized protein n=1 Tax=Thelephora terrestris TaxID=56493 RepID=A0A9P6L777_9AGAM|nr:hypothetical protein BJ322DRAFT_782187 [Thelephora terrestris]